jgi:hypothetical protein
MDVNWTLACQPRFSLEEMAPTLWYRAINNRCSSQMSAISSNFKIKRSSYKVARRWMISNRTVCSTCIRNSNMIKKFANHRTRRDRTGINRNLNFIVSVLRIFRIQLEQSRRWVANRMQWDSQGTRTRLVTTSLVVNLIIQELLIISLWVAKASLVLLEQWEQEAGRDTNQARLWFNKTITSTQVQLIVFSSSRSTSSSNLDSSLKTIWW